MLLRVADAELVVEEVAGDLAGTERDLLVFVIMYLDSYYDYYVCYVIR